MNNNNHCHRQQQEDRVVSVFIAIVYTVSMSVLSLSSFILVLDAGRTKHSGDVIAVGMFVLVLLLPLSILAMLCTLKMSRPRWPKALAAFVIWVVGFVAAHL